MRVLLTMSYNNIVLNIIPTLYEVLQGLAWVGDWLTFYQ